MNTTKLVPLTKEVKVKLLEDQVKLSENRVNQIEQFWNEINVNGSFHRGEVFHVQSIEEGHDSYLVNLVRSDYAHYLYSVRHPIDKESCNIIYSAGLLETTDGTFVFGEMASNTAYPGRLQCVGGGLSFDDLVDSYFHMENSVLRELSEELGLNPATDVVECTPKFIKTGGTFNFTTILYHMKIDLSESELKETYAKFEDQLVKQGVIPEFHKVHYVKRNEIDYFILHNKKQSVDYLFPLLRNM